MVEKSKAGVQPKRKKELNIIYFVDANKTHSFRIPFKIVAVIITLFCITGLWSVLSGIWVYNKYQKSQSISDRLSQTLATIFDYQTKYNGVYEMAYPDKKDQEENNLGALHQQSVDSQKIRQKIHEQQQKEKFRSLYDSVSDGELEVSLKWDDNDNTWPVKIEDAVLYRGKDQKAYELNFAIRNVKSPLKTEGYIWAIATFVTVDGQKFYVGAPDGVVANNLGMPESDASTFEYYSIRYYKAKSLTFGMNKKAFIAHIRIGMVDKKKSSIFDIPVQPEIDLNKLNNVDTAAQTEDPMDIAIRSKEENEK